MDDNQLHDTVTTVAGGTAALGLATQVDIGQVFHGNSGEIAKLIIAVSVGLLGFFSNRKKKT